MSERARWSIGVLVAALALAGCTAGTTSESSTSAVSSAQTSVTPSVVDPSPFSTPQPSPSAIVADPSPTTTGTGGVSLAPLPAGLSPEQIADAEAAIEVYRRYWMLSDELGRDPRQDWSQRIADVAIGSAADTFTSDLAYLNKSDLRTVGSTSVDVTVSKVEPALVHISGCVDVTATDVIDASGNSVGAENAPGAWARFPTTAQVGEFENGLWLVVVDTFDRTATC